MSKRILVVDQSRIIQTLLSTCFGNAGHQVIARSTPGEALRVLAGLRDAPDIVLLAIDQKQEAYKVVEYMKVRGAYAHTRLVALVLQEEKASIQRMLNGTHVSYLVKPFHIQDALVLVSASVPGAVASS